MFGDLQNWYFAHADKLAPAASLVSAGATISVGLVAAWIALARHRAQTDADIQRRITETYSRAVTQLSSEKIEERLGGIYTLERISNESDSDYWTVMETLTAFVRELSQRTEPELTERVKKRAYFLWLEANMPEGSAGSFWEAAEYREQLRDITAAMTVLTRRSRWGRKRETVNRWRLDLRDANLRFADFFPAEVHLERAVLYGAHLERAILDGARLEGADLSGAYLEGASLSRTHLEEKEPEQKS